MERLVPSEPDGFSQRRHVYVDAGRAGSSTVNPGVRADGEDELFAVRLGGLNGSDGGAVSQCEFHDRRSDLR